jgi:hypothetical protein
MRVVGTQVASLHTVGGVPLYQFGASDLADLSWRRELSETSTASVVVPTPLVETITPWLHWLSVWEGNALQWTGPVQTVTYGRETTAIDAADISILMGRTRVPLTKAWEATDPAVIAAELWRSMLEAQRLNGAPLVRRDPLLDVFDFDCVADAQMLDKLMDDLVGLGLCWTVVAGTVLLGPAARSAVASLGEDDFIDGNLTLVRDGSRVFTDVLVRAADDQTRARVNNGGLNLQTIVDLDSLFGVSNADRAARQYLRYCSTMREAVRLDGTTRLHPAAPVTIASLVPSVRVTVAAYGVLTPMEIQSVEVTQTTDDTTVAIGLESVEDNPPELVKTERPNG